MYINFKTGVSESQPTYMKEQLSRQAFTGNSSHFIQKSFHYLMSFHMRMSRFHMPTKSFHRKKLTTKSSLKVVIYFQNAFTFNELSYMKKKLSLKKLKKIWKNVKAKSWLSKWKFFCKFSKFSLNDQLVNCFLMSIHSTIVANRCRARYPVPNMHKSMKQQIDLINQELSHTFATLCHKNRNFKQNLTA